MNTSSLIKHFFVLFALFLIISIVRGQNTPVNNAFFKYEKIQHSKTNEIVRDGSPYVIGINTQDDLSNLNKQIRGGYKARKNKYRGVVFKRSFLL